MSGDLDRIRSLRDDAGGPSDRWVQDTREELLELADEELPGADAGALVPLRGRLDDLLARPASLAAAATAVVAVAVAGVTYTALQDGAGQPDRAAPPPPTAASAPAESAPADDPSSPTGDAGTVVLAASCTGGDGLYTVGYPEGWHTNPGDALGPCEVFDEQPVEIEEDTGGGPFGGITVRPVPAPFGAAAEPGRGHREISAETATVAGRPAVRAVWEATGETVLPAGMRSYRYVVDLGERTLLAVTYDVGSGDFAEHRDVLDRMMATLELSPGASS